MVMASSKTGLASRTYISLRIRVPHSHELRARLLVHDRVGDAPSCELGVEVAGVGGRGLLHGDEGRRQFLLWWADACATVLIES